MDIAEALAVTPVASLDLSRYVEVTTDMTVKDTVAAMSEAGLSCACVVEEGRLAGIFTQRDVLLRVIGRPSTWEQPISEQMTKSVKTMLSTQTVADGLAIMTDWWVRSVPVLDDEGRLAGNLSYYTLIRTIGNLLTSRLGQKAEEPALQHELAFIDFTGLNIRPPVVVALDDTVETAAHHMKARGIGSVLVVDDREQLAGVLTEFDLQTRIGCTHADLDQVTVKEIMSDEPVAISVRAPIADAIEEIIEHEFSHVPLLGETGRPVGVASFRDIAAYVEAHLDALA